MSQESNKVSFAGQRVYVGLDVHVQHWTVCVVVGDTEHTLFSQSPGDAYKLAAYLRKHFPGGEYHCVYEAGCLGFWVQRALVAAGLRCMVVHAPDVPSSNRQRRRRTDKGDARKLARRLSSNDLTGLYIPTPQQEQDRDLLRTRGRLVRKQTRCKNQITAKLRYYGIALPEDLRIGRWSGDFIAFLESLEFSEGSAREALELLLCELHLLRELLARAMRSIRVLARTERYRADVELLRTAPGVSVLSAMVFLTEIMDLSRFRSLDQLCSYAGLVPDEDSSGESTNITGITRRRNPHLRHILIQCAWAAMRKDPVLLNKYNELTVSKKRGEKSKAIISIARKLTSRLRRVLLTREPYVLGVVQ